MKSGTNRSVKHEQFDPSAELNHADAYARPVAVDDTIKFTSLELVRPPFSAQEAQWYSESEDADLEANLRSSNIYMIGARPEAALHAFDITENRIDFDIAIGDQTFDRCSISIAELPGMKLQIGETFEVVAGPKMIQVVEPRHEGDFILEWFTIEKLASDVARGRPGLDGVNVPVELLEFDLLYVGIATAADSYARVVKRAHGAKAKILSNEPQRAKGARVADEVFIFFFRADPLIIRTFSLDGAEETDFPYEPPDPTKIVEDLERAFISQLAPSYNKVQYENYPQGSTGINDHGFDRYGYVIAENLVFRTSSGQFSGLRDATTGLPTGGDLLIVEGKDVKIIRP